MKKKKNIICTTCGGTIHVYKRGRKHRAFVCDHCGLVAVNPDWKGAFSQARKTFVPYELLPESVKSPLKDIARELPFGSAIVKTGEMIAGTTPKELKTASISSMASRRSSAGDRLIKLIQAEQMLGKC